MYNLAVPLSNAWENSLLHLLLDNLTLAKVCTPVQLRITICSLSVFKPGNVLRELIITVLAIVFCSVADALLVYMGNGAIGGNGSDFLVVSLINGVVRVSMNLQDGMESATVYIETQQTYNDSRIHELEVTRSFRLLQLVVDDETVYGRGEL